jgi:peptidoglycan/LPS O-acetylase OafA/YrhL
LFPLTYGGDLIEFKHQIPHYFYLQNLREYIGIEGSGPGHYYTLAVEEHFYLLWPLIIFIIKPKHLSKFIFISILLIFLLKYFMLKDGLSVNKFTLTRIDQMMIGAYLAILELNGFFNKKNALKKILAAGFTTLPIMVVIFILDKKFPFLKEMFKYPLLGIFFFSLIGSLILISKDNIINRFLSSKVCQYLGKISYGIYVWHVLVLLFMRQFLLTGVIILDVILTFSLTILLAHVSYYYFEIRFLKLKNKKLKLFNRRVIND